MPNRRPNRNTPKVIGGVLDYGTETPLGTFYARLAVGSDAWFKWLTDDKSTRFYYETPAGGFTARREKRSRGGFYWTAYKRLGDKVYKRYLGKPEDVTPERLADVWRELDSLSKKDVTK